MVIKLGQTVEDRITGFKGIVTGRVEYITGCNQVLLVPRVNSEGARIEAEWFDEERVTVLDVVVFSLETKSPSGFDRPAPKG